MGKPIPKKPNPSSFDDLRIISILPVLSKIFERVLYNQIYEFASQNNILPPSQCGFRRGYSASVALTNVIDDVIRARDRNRDVVLVLLDFSKAFDTINHKLLCAKLRYYGFDVNSVSLMESYLFHRKQSIFSHGKRSSEVDILSGVPQGSILGPLLFIIYTADILGSVQSCKIQSYADDTQLYYDFDFRDYTRAGEMVNRDLNIIKQLSSDHSLVLNPTKSQIMIFANKNHETFLRESLNISVGDFVLPKVQSCRNLGLILDCELRFREHVKQLHKKSFLSLKLLYSNRHILNFRLRKLLCQSLVLSKYNYCDFIYGFAIDVVDRQRIQKVQNSCSRFIFGLRKFDHISHTLVDLNWLSMENRRLHHFGCFIHHIINGKDPPGSLTDRLVFRASVHSRDIRYKLKLTMPQHRTALFQRSFSFSCVKVFNQLPADLLPLSISRFKTRYKLFLLWKQNCPIV